MIENTTAYESTRPRRKHGCLRALGIAAAAIVVLCWWVGRPRYHELFIEVPPHKGGGLFWWDTQRTTMTLADEPGKLFILRRKGTGYADTHGWQDVEDVVRYFEDRIKSKGWVEAQFEPSGAPALPESAFIPYGRKKGFLAFTRPGDRWGYGGCGYLAVWPIDTVHGFHVVLATERRSFLNRLNKEMD